MTSNPDIGLANAVELLLAAVDEDWDAVNAVLAQATPDLLPQLLWLGVELANQVGMDDDMRERLRAALREPLEPEQGDGGRR